MTLPKRPRVLIAEDHPGVAKAICRLLALECDIVGNVADGRTVLDAAQRLQPDVIVVDLNLPHVHGFEVCRQIKHDNRDARVVVFSAMNDPDVRQRSLEVGASAFVCKATATCSPPSDDCVTTEVECRCWATGARSIEERRKGSRRRFDVLVCCVWIGLAANLRHLILLLDELQAVGVSWCIHEPKNAGGQRLTAPQSHAPYRAYGLLFQ